MKFNNVFKLSDKEFLTVLSAQQLVDMYKQGQICYNPLIQRGTKFKTVKDEIISVPVCSTTNIKKIKEAIKNKTYFVDMITLNIQNKGIPQINYNDGTKILEVKTDRIDIADGYHRLTALKELVEKDEERLNNYYFPVKITYLTLEEAQQQFYQFTLGLKISSSRAEFFNSNKPANIIVKKLMQSSLKDKVEVTKNTIGKKDPLCIVTFATLSNAIEMVYRPSQYQDIDTIYEYLDKFFYRLFEIFPEITDYNQRVQSKEESLVAENFMFYGYIAISKLIKDYPNWDELMLLLKDFDFRKDSSVWYGSIIKKGSNNKLMIINSSQTRRQMIEKSVQLFSNLLQQKLLNTPSNDDNTENPDDITEILIDEEWDFLDDINSDE